MENQDKYFYTPLPKPVPITQHCWPEGTQPLVHTLTMTFMHENYVRECIEGILMQKTTFPVQVLIHDDASTDKTVEIIWEYEKKYPQLIKAYYQKENTYMKSNRFKLRAEFNRYKMGKYEAICEGDDYWTDPLKLQRQIDFLEHNPGYGLCYTKAIKYSQKKKKRLVRIYGKKYISTEDFIVNWGQIPTLTTCFRRDLLRQYYKDIKPATKHWIFSDRSIWIWFSLNSKIHFINKITGTYRIRESSVSHKNSYEGMIKLRDNLYEIRKFFTAFYNLRYLEEIIENKKILEYAYLAIYFGKYDEYQKFIVQAKGNSIKLIIKKIIGKSMRLMKLYHRLSQII